MASPPRASRAGYHDYFVATEGTRFSMRHFKSERADQHIGVKETDQ